MKRILIIGLTERMGGVESFIYNTTIFSDKSKYEIDFLAHGTNSVLFEKEITDFYGGKNHFFFVSQFKSRPFKTFAQLCRFYKQHRYDIIHLQTGATFEIVYCFPFAFFYGTKVIVHSHNGSGFSRWINFLFRPVLNFTASKRLACSKVAASWLFGKRYLNSTMIVNNGIDVDKFVYSNLYRNNLRKKYSVENNFIMGHIGRFSEQKNHIFLLDVFRSLLQKRSDAILFLIGTGELYDEIWNLINKLNLTDKIIHVKNTNETYKYYSMFDCFCMPSLYEGLPIVGVEAQTSGLPCFFSENISPEIQLTECCNILSLNASPDYWAEKILNANYTRKRSAVGDVVRAAGFDIRTTTSQIAEIYQSL